MRVSAKADYAVRAMIELAAHADSGPRKGELISQAQDIPMPFLENILSELRHNGLVQSRRGAEGGYWLSRLPREVTIAEIIRTVEGPLASVRGDRPDEVAYNGAAAPLQRVWMALRSNIRDVLERVTLRTSWRTGSPPTWPRWSSARAPRAQADQRRLAARPRGAHLLLAHLHPGREQHQANPAEEERQEDPGHQAGELHRPAPLALGGRRARQAACSSSVVGWRPLPSGSKTFAEAGFT
jgi:Rrf2 family protein